MRLTKRRQEILDHLEGRGLVTAAELHAALPHIDLVTIYRSLDRFVVEGLLTRVPGPQKEAQYERQATPHHHAICARCQRVIHFEHDVRKIAALLSERGFTPARIHVTVEGTCAHPPSPR